MITETAQARQEQSCRRKAAYLTETEAQAHANWQSTALRRLVPSLCPVCGLWHVGMRAPTPHTHRR